MVVEKEEEEVVGLVLLLGVQLGVEKRAGGGRERRMEVGAVKEMGVEAVREVEVEARAVPREGEREEEGREEGLTFELGVEGEEVRAVIVSPPFLLVAKLC